MSALATKRRTQISVFVFAADTPMKTKNSIAISWKRKIIIIIIIIQKKKINNNSDNKKKQENKNKKTNKNNTIKIK